MVRSTAQRRTTRLETGPEGSELDESSGGKWTVVPLPRRRSPHCFVRGDTPSRNARLDGSGFRCSGPNMRPFRPELDAPGCGPTHQRFFRRVERAWGGQGRVTQLPPGGVALARNAVTPDSALHAAGGRTNCHAGEMVHRGRNPQCALCRPGRRCAPNPTAVPRFHRRFRPAGKCSVWQNEVLEHPVIEACRRDIANPCSLPHRAANEPRPLAIATGR